MTDDEWGDGRVTPNSAVLAGYIIGALAGVKHPFFKVVDSQPERGEIFVDYVDEFAAGGDLYRVTVEQIGGAQ